MRTIELTKEQREALSEIVSMAPDKGYSLDEVRRGVRVLDCLEGEEPLVALEESEWNFLCERIGKVQWRVASKDALSLVDLVFSAQETKLSQ